MWQHYFYRVVYEHRWTMAAVMQMRRYWKDNLARWRQLFWDKNYNSSLANMFWIQYQTFWHLLRKAWLAERYANVCASSFTIAQRPELFLCLRGIPQTTNMDKAAVRFRELHTSKVVSWYAEAEFYKDGIHWKFVETAFGRFENDFTDTLLIFPVEQKRAFVRVEDHGAIGVVPAERTRLNTITDLKISDLFGENASSEICKRL